MAGLDLHSNNVMAGVVDQEGKRIAQSKLTPLDVVSDANLDTSVPHWMSLPEIIFSCFGAPERLRS